MKSNRQCVIGIDAGGTKTAGIAVSLDGRAVARVAAGPSNYQSIGSGAAFETLAGVVRACIDRAGAVGCETAGIGYGLSGLDRPRDRLVLERLVSRIGAPGVSVLKNDTFLVLRAGTDDGIGVAVVSGTGSNTVGVGRDGSEARVGGLGYEFGDTGAGHDIAVAGIRAARRGRDGRGPSTLIGDLLLEALSISDIEDLVDFTIPPEGGDLVAVPPPGAAVGRLAPIVFEAARLGDEVARTILRGMGQDLGLSVRLVAGRLFGADEAFPLVLGGSVLMKASDPTFAEAIVAGARTAFPRIEASVLAYPPVVGGALLALDALAAMDPSSPAADVAGDGGFRRRIGEAATNLF